VLRPSAAVARSSKGQSEVASIVVVGGGLAGLACGWRLQRAGHDVEVLEQEVAPAALVRAHQRDGFQIEAEPAYLADHHSTLHGMVARLGLADELRRIEPHRIAVLRGGRFEAIDPSSPQSLLLSPLLSRRARLRLTRAALTLARQGSLLDATRPELAAPLEREDAATDLARSVGVEVRDFMLGPLLAMVHCGDLEQSSDAFARVALRTLLRGVQVEAMVGGPGRLAQAMVEHVPLRPRCQVIDVSTEAAGVRILFRSGGRERRVFADAAVVAVAAPRVAALCSTLTAVEREFFATQRVQRVLRAHLLLDEAPGSAEFFAAALPEALGLDVTGIGFDHHRPGAAPPGAGLLSLTFSASASDRLWNAADDKVALRGLEALERTPLAQLRPRATVVQRREHGLPRFEAGGLGRLARFLTRTDASPRLAFAGDYLVAPYTEGALASGLRAALEVLRRIDASTELKRSAAAESPPTAGAPSAAAAHNRGTPLQ
jgi:oxygen-dependent protoporphyrinogen oxidase